MKKLHIIKVGGNVIDDTEQLDFFLKDVAGINQPKIIVHGGGKLATAMAGKLGIKQTMVEGKRVTDAETLKITVMVYAGYVNKTIVAKLQALQCNAIGISGVDGNLMKSKKRERPEIDFGYVGDVNALGVNTGLLKQLLNEDMIPVISPITHDGKGNLLNTNADTIAATIASALATSFDVSLTFCFEKNGVLANISDDNSCFLSLNKQDYLRLKSEKIISEGMLPKLDNAFMAIEAGVKQVTVCHSNFISDIETKLLGTQIIN